jgi:spermidine/putrescine transport system permease protein
MKTRNKRLLQRTYLILFFGFMYLPIAYMIVFSFNQSKGYSLFTGVTLKWYTSLFHDAAILRALALSLEIAFVSAIIATVLGTAAAIGINSMGKKSRLLVSNITYVPVVNPEIITGISLMLLFVAYQGFAAKVSWLPDTIMGFPTLVIAHIAFNVPYVIFNVGPKFRQMDVRLYEAALDLGCDPRQAFFKVILPEISPAVLSSFLICLTYSIDDFMISYFNSGTRETLPIAIYSMTRKKVSPEIYALSTIIFVVILTIILISNAMDTGSYRRDRALREGRK